MSMVTTKQKSTVDSQKIKLWESKHTTMEESSIHKGRQQERNKGTIKQPETIKMALVSLYLSIITLNVNGLNSPIKRHTVAENKTQL